MTDDLAAFKDGSSKSEPSARPSADSLTAFLDAVEARAAAATPGPWERGNNWTIVANGTRPDGSGANIGAVPVLVNHDGGTRGGEYDGNAEFIAAARSDLPVLVGMVRAVLARHHPETNALAGRPWCYECSTPARALLGKTDWSAMVRGDQDIPWPCPTVAALLGATPGDRPEAGSPGEDRTSDPQPPTPTAEETKT